MATVEQIIEESTSRATELLAEADVFIEELRLSASEEFQITMPDANGEQGHSFNRIEYSAAQALTPVLAEMDASITPASLRETLAYATDYLDNAIGALEHDIDNLGTGIRPEDETALWDRARDRISKVAQVELTAAQRDASSKGFSLPTGADFALAAKAAQSVTEKLSELNREIAVKRADLIIAQRNFALTQTVSAAVSMAQVKLQEWNGIFEHARLKLAQTVEQARAYFEAGNHNLRLSSERNSTQLSWEKLQFDEWAKSVESYYTAYRETLNKVRLELDGLTKASDIRMKAAETGVNMYSNAVASAQNAVSAIATLAE